ncbi:MAG: hypothetical protein HQK53_05205 [Oligoflexia bacterium]|nr:hypothetical protein [Oligoflexia bacterium]
MKQVNAIDKLELLAEELLKRIGPPLSLKSLGEDLEVDSKTIKHRLEIFFSLYYTFQISPCGAPKIRAVKKEQKLYFWDLSLTEEQGARFENLVTSHLLKYCHHYEDVYEHKMELRYIRDTDKREFYFVVIKNHTPLFAVEYKLSERSLSPHISYFKARTKIRNFYQVHLDQNECQVASDIMILPFG